MNYISNQNKCFASLQYEEYDIEITWQKKKKKKDKLRQNLQLYGANHHIVNNMVHVNAPQNISQYKVKPEH